MSKNLTVLIPVLRRPWRVASVNKSVREATPHAYVMFITSPGDEATMKVLREMNDAWVMAITMDESYEGQGDYARKINAAMQHVRTEYVFQGADDLNFHPGWYEAAMNEMGDGTAVVGTNDLGNPWVMRGEQATHSLVSVDYVQQLGTIDEPGKMLHEGYPHCFVDNEFIETAQYRGAFKSASDAVVEHMHPDWGKGERDSVYDTAAQSMDPGRKLYYERRHLWGK